MKPIALTTVLVPTTVMLLGLVLIVRAPAEVLQVGFRTVDMVPFVVLQFAFTGVGSLLAWRRPENRVGWMLCGTAMVAAALFLMAGLTAHGISTGDTLAVPTTAWLYGWFSILLGATLGPALATFPDGRVTSRAARTALMLLFTTIVLSIVAIALRPGPLAVLPSIENPYAWRDHGGALDAIFAVGLAAGLGAMWFGVYSQIARFRRSSGVERQQLKWFLAGAMVMSLLIVPSVAWSYGGSDATDASAQRYAGRVIGALASTAMPIAIGIAILRHRLYEIDVLINRTLVYGALTGTLALAYFVAVAALQTALRPLAGSSELAVAGSTLAVVAVFAPLRTHIQRFVDRRFYRSRYDAARTLDAFGARLRDEVDLDAVRADLLDAVHDTVRPAHAGVWLRR